MDLSIYNPNQFPRPGAQSGAGAAPRAGAQNAAGRSGQARPAETGQATPSQDGPEATRWSAEVRGGSRAREGDSATRPDPQEQRRIRELQVRDREVRSHEAAHLATAGPYAEGGAQLQFQQGPDNRFYAVGGEVRLDTARPEDPEKAQDKAAEARAELQREEGSGESGGANRSDTAYRQAAEGDAADRSGVRLDRMI